MNIPSGEPSSTARLDLLLQVLSTEGPAVVKQKKAISYVLWIFDLVTPYEIHVVGFKDFIYIYILQKGREREREGEKHQCVVASHAPPTGKLACNPGMCPDWELNWQPLDSQAGTQSTEPHQPGPCCCFKPLSFELFWYAARVTKTNKNVLICLKITHENL